MKHMHTHGGVESLNHSIKFYSALFEVQPVKAKTDFAKWMQDDPRINVAILARSLFWYAELGEGGCYTPETKGQPNACVPFEKTARCCA